MRAAKFDSYMNLMELITKTLSSLVWNWIEKDKKEWTKNPTRKES